MLRRAKDWLSRQPVVRQLRDGFLDVRRLDAERYLVRVTPTVVFEARLEDLAVVRDVFHGRRYGTLFPYGRRATVVDVGGHCGSFSVFAATWLAEGSRVVALEPDPANAQLFRSNVARNALEGRVELVAAAAAAAAAAAGRASLHMGRGRSANSSLFAAPGEHLTDVVEVPTLGLRDLLEQRSIDKVDFLKLDCEGGEYGFLLGADDRHLRQVETVSLEYHDMRDPDQGGANLATRLAKAGFSIVELRQEPTGAADLNFGRILATRLW